MSPLRILIVEDNRVIAANLCDHLEAAGHSVDVAHDGATGYQFAARQECDVILLDLGLPRMDGMELCRRLREETGADTPILVLTARDTLDDKLQAFSKGADDYLVKPFALQEVEARLNALYKRRAGKTANRTMAAGDLVFDGKTMKVHFCGIAVALSPKCLRIVEVMIRQPDRLFSRQELERELWGEEQDNSDRLRHHMHLLRQALTQACGRDPVKTVHGMGYRLSSSDA